MDRFHQLNVFVAVAEEQGFASAARRLDLSPPAVTRAVAQLEQRLGVKLLNRTTRFVRTTDAGQLYLEDVRRVLADVETADAAVAGVSAAPRGHLSVTAPAMFGRIFVTPRLVAFLEQYPETEISALFLDRDVNLLEEGVDVAIRIGDLPDSSLRARRIGEVRQVVCAAPEYLQRSGIPQHPQELAQHNLVVSTATGSMHRWQFDGARPVRLQPQLALNTNDAVIEAALSGFGVTRLLSYQVSREVAAGRLQILLEDYEPRPRPIHIVHREGRFTPARIRAFIDFIIADLGAEPLLR